MKPTYLFIDDKVIFRPFYEEVIKSKQPHALVLWATTHEEAQELFYEHKQSIVLIGVDGSLLPGNNLDTLELILTMRPQTNALMLSISDTARFHKTQVEAGCDDACFKSDVITRLSQWMTGGEHLTELRELQKVA